VTPDRISRPAAGPEIAGRSLARAELAVFNRSRDAARRNAPDIGKYFPMAMPERSSPLPDNNRER